MTVQEDINLLNTLYGHCLDSHDYETWIDFFTPDCLYLVQSRENHDRGLPLALIRLESQDMMRDRMFGCMDTIFHQPYYQRHVIGGVWLQSSREGIIITKTNYAVFRTKPTQASEVFNVGCYHDQWIITVDGYKLRERKCVYDSEMVLNALIYPV
jgi:salicylate 5-hydroxylase small subunit